MLPSISDLYVLFTTMTYINFQAVFGMVIRDGGLPVEMDVNTAQGINLSMLVLNLLSCMCNNQQTSDLNPLAELINQPLEAANHFLPTMVDNQVELYAAVFKATIVGTNVTIFRKLSQIYSLGISIS